MIHDPINKTNQKDHSGRVLWKNFQFSKIIFIPVNTKNKDLISMSHRINMLSIYKKKYSFLDIDNIMNNYSYFDYRILDLLKKKYGKIKIIIGSDILEKMNQFDHKEYLLNNFYFCVITRNVDVKKIIQDKYLEYQDHFEIFNYSLDISSTMARELIKNNKNTKNILEEEIRDYIINHHLYF